MATIKIFIISDSLTFSEGLKSLLQATSGMKVIGQEQDICQALTQIKKQKPKVVIWASTGLKREPAGKERTLLKAIPTLRVVCLNLQNNEISLYYADRKIIRMGHEVQDLTLAIKESLVPQPESIGQQLSDIFRFPSPPRSMINQS